MEILKINHDQCTLCQECIEKCPFQALEINQNRVEINASCKMCKICVKACPMAAISLQATEEIKINKDEWQGVLVYIEQSGAKNHKVAYELIGEGRKLADKIRQPLKAVMIGGKGTEENGRKLLQYGVDEVFVYEDEELAAFRVDNYTNILEDCIQSMKPAVVLVGATPLGRSLAPRTATRFRTGLTADCTQLDIKENTDLVQIRPAFGGNIMAQIVTANARPQFATVRYKVMEKAEKTDQPKGILTKRTISPELLQSDIEVLETRVLEKKQAIEEAEVLVVAGKGLKNQKDLALLEDLAKELGGQMAYTRPLIEAGWGRQSQQIGLSGRTVKPKLIITCGVSGAIQFTAGMSNAECIVSINSDPEALIFRVSHYCIMDDLHEVVPRLTAMLKERQED